MSNVKIIILVRSNIVKTAVSSYMGKQMHKICGQSNMKRKHKSSCKIPPNSVNWKYKDFLHDVSLWKVSYGYGSKSIASS